jgi:signal transduction histidine kinase/DNA-binding response OmpR family regulator
MYSVVLLATDFEGYPQKQVLEESDIAYVSNFVTYPDYPITCLSGMYKDTHGRIWFYDCSIANSTNHGLYKFNGYSFEYVKFENNISTKTYKAYTGIIDDKLYGNIQTKTGTQLFYHDLKHRKIIVFDTVGRGKSSMYTDENRKVYYSQYIYNDTVYSYAADKEKIRLRRYDKNAQLIDTNAASIAEITGDTVDVKSTIERFAYYKDYALFFDNRSQDIRVTSLLTNASNKIDISRYLKPGETYALRLQNKYLEVYNENNTGFYFKIKENPELKLSYLEKFEQQFRWNTYAEDAQGNIIKYIPHKEKGTLLLMTTQGQTYDISILLKYFNYGFGGTQIKSDNFLESISIHDSRSYFVFKLNINPDILKITTQSSIRSIVQPQDSIVYFLDEYYLNSNLRRYGLNSETFLAKHKNCGFGGLDLEYVNDKIWGRGENGLLYSYDTKSNSRFAHDITANALSAINETELIVVDGRFRFWKFNTNTFKKTLLLDKSLPFKIESEYIEVLQDNKGILWIASNLGLHSYDVKNQKLTAIKGMDSYNMSSLLLLEDERLLIGTLKNGLLVYDIKDKSFESITTKDGLPNNSISTITKDRDGYYWIATYKGIGILDQELKHLKNLYVKDGLVHNEANRKSALLLNDGRIAIGSMGGISILNPHDIINTADSDKNYNLYFTSIDYFDGKKNERINIDKGFDALKTITLSPSSRDLNLEFALSNLIYPEQNKYSYKISGIQNEWKDLGNFPRLSLIDLEAGTYNISVRGSDQNGNLASNLLHLQVVQEDYFYNSLWFYALIVLLLGTLVFFWISALKLKVKQATSKIGQQKVALEKLNEAKTNFFTNITHEFRTPLTIINGIVSMLKPKHQESKPEFVEIENNANQLLNMVNQILDLRKLESHKMKVQLVQTDVIKYVDYIVDAHHYLAKQKSIDLSFSSEIKALHMDIDEEKWKTILTNLLSNAIKYTPDGGKVSAAVRLKEDKSLCITIQDNGVGISETEISRLTEYFEVSSHNGATANSSGIGLSVSKKLVELLDGHLNITSQLGQGTCVEVVFPITHKGSKKDLSFAEIAHVEETSVYKSDDVTDINSEKDIKVLVVEDNTSLQHILTQQLDGYSVITATDGSEGIEKAIMHIPDLIVSDVMMPKTSGYELCETLKADIRTSHIPIVLLTAKADQSSKIEGLKARADAYLYKPYDVNELKLILHNLIAYRKKLQEQYRTLRKDSPPTEKPTEDKFILAVRSLILNNLKDESFGVNTICEQLDISRTQLHMKLKALTSLSATKFIVSVRLDEAKELMKKTSLNLGEISLKVGFLNHTYFSSQFKEKFGMSPREWRDSLND